MAHIQLVMSWRYRANVINMTITETGTRDKWSINRDLDCDLWIFDTASIMCPTKSWYEIQIISIAYIKNNSSVITT